MPAIVADGKDAPFHKPPFLEEIERIANLTSVRDLRRIAKLLRSSTALEQIYTKLKDGTHRDLEHVSKDWLHPKQSWWASEKPAKKLRAGFLRVIALRIKHKLSATKPLPVAYWWLPTKDDRFRVVPLLGPGQVTVVLATPHPPSLNDERRSRRAPARRRKAR